MLKAERVADHFVNYLFDVYEGNALHVRRVSSWLGLVALGIEKVRDSWQFSHSRQLVFEVGDLRYKAKYDHNVGTRGGISIVEIGKTQGSPEIRVAKTIRNLADAENFYLNPKL